jgi:hypothetical protein
MAGGGGEADAGAVSRRSPVAASVVAEARAGAHTRRSEQGRARGCRSRAGGVQSGGSGAPSGRLGAAAQAW